MAQNESVWCVFETRDDYRPILISIHRTKEGAQAALERENAASPGDPFEINDYEIQN